MDGNDVFQRNMKTKVSDVVKNPQELMVGLKKEKEEEKKELSKEEDFDTYPEITEKTKEKLKESGIASLFPIQSSTFKHIYDNKDLIARDLTGSGKTLAFCLPLVERYRKLEYFTPKKTFARNLYTVIMTPTRELALQVSNELKKLMHRENEYRVLTVYGGVPIEHQEKELRYGVEFFVGTWGRVLDHISRGNIDFSNIKAVILDEADQMLNMGFEEDIEEIIDKIDMEVKEKPQFLLFSATIPDWFKSVAKKYLNKEYEVVDLVKNLKNKTSHTVNHLALNCPFENKISVLADVLRWYGGLKGKSIVFTQTKLEANDIILSEKMRNNAEVLHGDIAQKQREVTLRRFKEGKFNVLVATDVAARGLDIPNVDLVVQLEPPKDIEAYIHRSGRTARAGKDGMCITFYTGREFRVIKDIEYEAGIKFNKITPPKNEDVIKVAAADVIVNLRNVDKKILPIFEDAATQFIDEVGAKEALWMALAYISDTSNAHLSSRSFLTGEDGLMTYILKSDRGINNVAYAHRLIQNNFSKDIAYKVKGIKLLRSGEGIVFDINEDNAEDLDQQYKEQACTSRGLPFVLERASELPEVASEGHRYTKSSQGYGKRGGKNGGFMSARSHYNQSFSGYNHGSKGMTRNYKGNDHETYDAQSMRSERSDFDKKEVSGISFGDKPKFFSRNQKMGEKPSSNTEGKSFGRNEFGRGRGSQSRGGYRGRGRGRGY